MFFRKIKNVIKQGFQGMWRNRGMGVASVTSISAVLFILGVVLILVLSINSLVVDTQEKLDEVEIFLEDDLIEEDKDIIKNKVKDLKGVVSIDYRSKDEALDIIKEDWEDDAYLLEGLDEENPLPESFVVKLEDLKYADKIVKLVEDEPGVVKVNYHEEPIEKLLLLAKYVQTGGLIVIAILIIVSVFIISNTIKLTVNSRSREINIMKYVGATNAYIKGPFIIEGVLFGLMGGLIALFIINYGYGYIFDIISDRLFDFLNVALVKPTDIVKDIAIIFLTIGAGIGALGSIISMKRFLDV